MKYVLVLLVTSLDGFKITFSADHTRSWTYKCSPEQHFPAINELIQNCLWIFIQNLVFNSSNKINHYIVNIAVMYTRLPFSGSFEGFVLWFCYVEIDSAVFGVVDFNICKL